jgi:hypothetical protein
MRCGSAPPDDVTRCDSRSSDSARWAPRLVGASAWISSTMMVSTRRSPSRACDPSNRYSDSGVVIRMSPGSRPWRRRSRAAVSPVRTSTVIGANAAPVRAATCCMPASGTVRLRSTSYASALSGDT